MHDLYNKERTFWFKHTHHQIMMHIKYALLSALSVYYINHNLQFYKIVKGRLFTKSNDSDQQKFIDFNINC